MKVTPLALTALILLILFAAISNGCSFIPLSTDYTSITVGYPKSSPPDNVVTVVFLPREEFLSLAIIPKGYFDAEHHGKTWITVDEFKEGLKRMKEWRKSMKQYPRESVNTKQEVK